MLTRVLNRVDAAVNLALPPPLAPETRASFTASCREEILKLQDLIRRDLSAWLKT